MAKKKPTVRQQVALQNMQHAFGAIAFYLKNYAKNYEVVSGQKLVVNKGATEHLGNIMHELRLLLVENEYLNKEEILNLLHERFEEIAKTVGVNIDDYI